MPVTESKFAHAILKKIRTRTEGEPARSSVPSSGASQNAGQKVSVREAQFSDFRSVSALGKRLGQGPDSTENWERLWKNNPVVRDGQAPSRIGWILEAGGEAVGFLGGIPLVYEFGGKTLIASATCRFAVDTDYRASSHLLMTSFLRQKEIDLFLNSTATPAAGKIMTALKAMEIPQREYGVVLFWVINAREFARVVTRKVGVPSALGTAGGFALKTESLVRGRKPRLESRKYEVVQRDFQELGADFDEFCAAQADGTRIMAKRSTDIMRWHFCPPNNRRTSKVLCAYSASRLVGYVVVRNDVDESVGLRRTIIADLLVEKDNVEIVQALLVAAYEWASKNGSFVLELMGFPASIRDAVMKWSPYSRQYPSCPFFFKTRDKGLQAALSNESAWYASPFDGDATLWP